MNEVPNAMEMRDVGYILRRISFLRWAFERNLILNGFDERYFKALGHWRLADRGFTHPYNESSPEGKAMLPQDKLRAMHVEFEALLNEVEPKFFVRYAPRVNDLLLRFSAEGQLKVAKKVADHLTGTVEFYRGIQFNSTFVGERSPLFFVASTKSGSEFVFRSESEQEILDQLGTPKIRRRMQAPPSVLVKATLARIWMIHEGFICFQKWVEENKSRLVANGGWTAAIDHSKPQKIPDLSIRANWDEKWSTGRPRFTHAFNSSKYAFLIDFTERVTSGEIPDDVLKQAWELYQIGEIHES